MAGSRAVPLVVLRVAVVALTLTTCQSDEPTPPTVELPPPSPSLSLQDGTTEVLVGAGDIASCGWTRDEATAALIDNISGTVVAAGDNAYPDGTASQYATCYDSSWGRHKARTRPAAGNHDYRVSGASGYFDYFGAAAGDAGNGYYSYDLGDWHIIVLNSNIPRSAGSPQEQWLRADLAASPQQRTLAYWHHPRFTSSIGRTTNSSIKPLWDALYDAGTWRPTSARPAVPEDAVITVSP